MAANVTVEKILDDSGLWYYYPDDIDNNIIYITEYTGFETNIVVPSVLIKDGVEKIVKGTYYLFYKDENIVMVEFSEGIEIIGSCTCYQCLNLVDVKIPEGVTTLETYSFWNCENIEKIVLPNSTTNIEEGSFCNCEKLTSINIPEAITDLSIFLFKNCPVLTISVKLNSYGLQYCMSNDLKYLIIDQDISYHSNTASQFFLAGVANAEIFKGNELFSTAKTLIDSSITIGVSAEDIRAGQGAKLYGKYFHTSTFDLKLSDAMFKLEYLAANVGAELELGGDVFTEEEHVAEEGGKFKLAKVPTAMSDGEKVYVYYKKGNDSYYKVLTLISTGDSKNWDSKHEVTISEATTVGEKYCIKYLYTNDAARKVVVKANFTPDTLSVYLTANLYSGDVNNPQTGTKVGTVTIKVPRFLLNGSQEIAMSMTGAANTPLEGSALASKREGCDGDGIYAEIIEVITGRTYNDLVDLKIQNSEDVLVLYPGEIYHINIYGRFNDTYFAKLDNTKIDFISTAPDYAEVSNDGIITAKQSSFGVSIPIIASLTNTITGQLKYAIVKIIVR